MAPANAPSNVLRAYVEIMLALGDLDRAGLDEHVLARVRAHLEMACRAFTDGATVVAPPTKLSAREVEVLRLVADGLSNAEIAAKLFISGLTVKRHVANILTKLELPSRAAAAVYGARAGLL